MDKGHNMGHAEVRGATDKGLWLQIEDIPGDDIFVPFDHIHEDSEVYKKSSEPGDLIVTEWLADKRGWA